ncbi:TetR/AcrR family transcriptional regulator [Cohaesibacter gelatinilyticus]|uniref:Transcriptional regulator, TetR family n=1 Tax=Cohaesibacter gelatinilyticus TaxID=372072 RepID=A0A285PGP9_9HYPH|nr:TetR/AcrR family transcriptional regulator [Cohaesibacter gelatinilyticus]SNZ20905.1 transcriptional regulator, TetR family [Cohaesibacter gelatinilyticus]HAT84932.1 TetR/AcrR family transcriptional regulator [Hyphomicrobiales bacterium]
MSRAPGSSGEKTLKAIYEAGIELIYQHGYEAVSLRQLAGAVGIQAGSLYNHIASKQDLLFKLLHSIVLELNEELDAALADIDDPEEAMRAFVRYHITWYTASKQKVFIGNMELRSLKAENYTKIVALRRRYEMRLKDILDRGIEQNRWSMPDSKVSARALIAMLSGICGWYNPDGPYSIEELVEMYTQIVFNGLGPSS